MKLKIRLAIVALASPLSISLAFADTAPATAFIDWSTFTVTLASVGAGVPAIAPAIAWPSQTSSANANSNPAFSTDWTTPVTATDGVVAAAADGAQLLAEFSGVPADLNSSASVFRNGSFTLTPRSLVVFTVMATTYINMNIPLNGTAYARAYLYVDGPGAFGDATQHSGVQSISLASGLGSPETDTRTLQAQFTNLTDHSLDGMLTSFAGVSKNGFIPAIPEPRAYAMMLAGLGLLGLVARRRKVLAVSA